MNAFWLLTAASAVSMVGTTFLFVAAPLAILSATDSPLLAVLSVAARTLPYLLGPLLGPVIDRYDRRAVYAVADLGQAAAVAVVPLCLANGSISGVYGALFALGIANVVSNVASDYGLIPALVPKERLQKATSHYNSVLLVARFVGPALAGVVIGVWGTSWALLIDSATFLLTALAAACMPRPRDELSSGASWSQMLREGFACFRARPDLRRLTLALALYNLGAGAAEPTLITVGGAHWDYSAEQLGGAVSCGAVAAALGAWLSGRGATTQAGTRRRLVLWLAVCATGSLAMLFPWPAVVLAGFSVLCLGEGGVNTISMAYRQEAVTGALAGRVNTIIRTFVMAAWSASAVVLGFAADMISPRWVFVPACAAAVVSCWLWWRARPLTGPLTPSVQSADTRSQP